MTIFATPRLLPLGDGALTVQFGDEVSRDANARVLGFITALERERELGRLAGVSEWIGSYAAVTLIVDGAGSEPEASERDARLLALAAACEPRSAAGRHWLLPACFDADLAPDLADLARAKGLTVEQALSLLTHARLRVYALGFLPGFAYMGGLPAELDMPRRASPRNAVPVRSIAVAGRMCGVYPWVSPGGWHLVGRSPVRLFDPDAEPAALLQAGDEVSWRPVDRATYEALEAEAAGTAPFDRGSLLAPPAAAPPGSA